MAQNITLLGATYNDVPAVDLPKSGGGTARFIDITESGTPVYDGTTTSDTKYDALFLETLASGVDTVNVGLDMDLLWTNSSPTSSFASQTVSVDLSDYAGVLIVCKQHKSVESYFNFLFLIAAESIRFLCGSGKLAFRNATVSSSGIVFTDGSYVNTYGTDAVNNDYVIPYKIYGIR